MDRLVGLFGRDSVYVELQRHFRRDEEADNAGARRRSRRRFIVPVIATNGVRFATTAERPLFDVVTCIHHHTTLAQAGRRLAPNAERYLKPPAEMAALFSDRPDAIARTGELADRLQYHDGRSRLPVSRTTRCRRAKRRRRFCGRSSSSARAIATVRITIARARRWRASSISSRS